jgi:hypothetical protein
VDKTQRQYFNGKFHPHITPPIEELPIYHEVMYASVVWVVYLSGKVSLYFGPIGGGNFFQWICGRMIRRL